MFWTKLLSWGAGAWLPLAVFFLFVAALGIAYGTGRSHANTAWEARWAAADAKAREATAKVVAAQNERLLASNGALKDAQDHIAARDAAISLLAGRLRDLAATPRPVSQPAPGACSLAELAAERDRAGALGELLVRGSDLARTLAAERDDAVARLWAADQAWPR